ncbi:MAG: hypothetical protein IPH74_10105 [Bacteroidetes bacterium]|nr:hypothetical protein [Bacteroidota bacterium]
MIISLCEEDKIDAPDNLLTKLSIEQQQKQKQENKTLSINLPQNNRNQNAITSVKDLCSKLKSHAIKFNKNAALNVVFDISLNENLVVSFNMQSNHDYICGAIAVKDEKHFHQDIPIIAEDTVDIAFIDADTNGFLENQIATAKNFKNTTTLSYSDQDIWVKAVEDQTIRLLDENIENKEIVIFGNGYKGKSLYNNFKIRNANVSYANIENSIDIQKLINADIIILWENADKFIKPIITLWNKNFLY